VAKEVYMAKTRRRKGHIVVMDGEILDGAREIMKAVGELNSSPERAECAQFLINIGLQLLYDAQDGLTEIHVLQADGTDRGKNYSIEDEIRTSCSIEED
jgi:hypothetical protein